MRHEIGFGPVFTHAAYLLNLSTNNSELYEKSVVALGMSCFVARCWPPAS
jgi:endonuclease IV